MVAVRHARQKLLDVVALYVNNIDDDHARVKMDDVCGPSGSDVARRGCNAVLVRAERRRAINSISTRHVPGDELAPACL